MANSFADTFDVSFGDGATVSVNYPTTVAWFGPALPLSKGATLTPGPPKRKPVPSALAGGNE